MKAHSSVCSSKQDRRAENVLRKLKTVLLDCQTFSQKSEGTRRQQRQHIGDLKKKKTITAT